MTPSDLKEMRNLIESSGSWSGLARRDAAGRTQADKDEEAEKVLENALGDLDDLLHKHLHRNATEALMKKLDIDQKQAEDLLRGALSGERVPVVLFGRRFDLKFD